MVDEQLRSRGIRDERLLKAFLSVLREDFIDPEYSSQAYADHPIPIACDQTTSQPYIIALMISQLQLKGHERILEVGTGSGYQTALLALLAGEVFSIECIEALSQRAAAQLRRLGMNNVCLMTGDGSLGWAKQAPFDGIIVSAACPEVPMPLIEQLKLHGRLVLPVGSETEQSLVVIEKEDGALKSQVLGECVFVPLVGRYGWKPRVTDA